jgi:hypothetical protein
MAERIVALEAERNKVLKEYNEHLYKNFEVVEDGKPLTKLDMINLIRKVK